MLSSASVGRGELGEHHLTHSTDGERGPAFNNPDFAWDAVSYSRLVGSSFTRYHGTVLGYNIRVYCNMAFSRYSDMMLLVRLVQCESSLRL